jgi:5'-methylthioadenosine phosphorylase
MEGQNMIGIIGGSGLYDMPELEVREKLTIDTPFGDPSDTFVRGSLAGVEVVFLARHGHGHRISAPGVNYRANVFGMKTLGVDTLISVNAVGSMREDFHPTDIVIPDQFFDFSKTRKSTFFEGAPAVHVDFADPVCAALSGILFDGARAVGANVHMGGMCISIEGPAFSTRAESNLYRSWGADVIGMTSATEAKLAREAEMCYASLSLVTDYDVWKERAEDVTAGLILANMRITVETAREILKRAIPDIPANPDCPCRSALASAIASDPSVVPGETRSQLAPLLSRYLPVEE